MLGYSQHRLWLSRIAKPLYQQQALEFIHRFRPENWVIQVVSDKENPGFVSTREIQI
jgi:hypothetical protein